MKRWCRLDITKRAYIETLMSKLINGIYNILFPAKKSIFRKYVWDNVKQKFVCYEDRTRTKSKAFLIGFRSHLNVPTVQKITKDGYSEEPLCSGIVYR
jgi:hypothetical protein